MSASFLSPAHGSALSLRPCREIVTVRICAGRGRTHRYIIGFNRPSTPNSARTQSAAILPGCGNWRTAIERTQAPIVLAVRHLLQHGRRWISNFCRPQHTAGKCFFRIRSLVHDANQSTRGILQTFSLSPVLSSALLFHATKHAAEDGIDHGKSVRKHG